MAQAIYPSKAQQLSRRYCGPSKASSVTQLSESQAPCPRALGIQARQRPCRRTHWHAIGHTGQAASTMEIRNMKGDREAEGVNKPPAAQASLASLHFPLLLYPPSLPLKHTADEQGLEIALGEAMKTRIVTHAACALRCNPNCGRGKLLSRSAA
jgi:hypothetical protein